MSIVSNTSKKCIQEVTPLLSRRAFCSICVNNSRGHEPPTSRNWHNFEPKMWKAYLSIAPQAEQIRQLFESEGEFLQNDHVAFRTLNHPRVDLSVMAKHLEFNFDYIRKDSYEIPDKNLTALHFQHNSKNPKYPLIFISQLHCDKLSHTNREVMTRIINEIPASYSPVLDNAFLIKGKLWDAISIQEYEALEDETDYGAWLAAFGYIPNHFTVSINELKDSAMNSIEKVNHFLEANHFELNDFGGKVKGQISQGLLQSSTMAPFIDVAFAEGKHKSIRGGYYEFAQRFQIESAKGKQELFEGFVGTSADKIFESTNNQN